MKNFPRISIVTVSFNQREYLEHTITSVLGQNYPNLEYIIIDGGSTDGSVDLIRKYEKQLAYWVSEKDNGMYDGLQKGLSRATGEIMAWINSDDIFHPNSFFVAGEIFAHHPEVEWLQGMQSVIDEKGRTVFVKNFRKWSKYHYFLGDKDHIQQESTFWRKSLWDKAGGSLDTSLRLAGDYELWTRFFTHTRLYCVRTILGAFRMRSKDQLSLERMGEYNAEVSRVLEKQMERISPREKETIARIRRYYSFYSRIPFLRKSKAKELDSLFDYPFPLSFDRKNGCFRIDDI